MNQQLKEKYYMNQDYHPEKQQLQNYQQQPLYNRPEPKQQFCPMKYPEQEYQNHHQNSKDFRPPHAPYDYDYLAHNPKSNNIYNNQHKMYFENYNNPHYETQEMKMLQAKFENMDLKGKNYQDNLK